MANLQSRGRILQQAEINIRAEFCGIAEGLNAVKLQRTENGRRMGGGASLCNVTSQVELSCKVIPDGYADITGY